MGLSGPKKGKKKQRKTKKASGGGYWGKNWEGGFGAKRA